jgi:glycosyltransferase involved in cell wall biosynthesis
VIVGEGQEKDRLRCIAGPTIEFLGWRSDCEVADLLSRCRALIFPGEEDFGILPVEAMACGRPVIAYGRGGATETIIPLNSVECQVSSVTLSECPHRELNTQHSTLNTPTGIFFYEQTVEALVQAVDLFERSSDRFDPEALRTHALTFDRSIFEQRIASYIGERLEEWKRGGRRRRSC